jgi:hypothetical protein
MNTPNYGAYLISSLKAVNGRILVAISKFQILPNSESE